MYAMTVNFHLQDWTDDAYRELCDQVAPAFADVPGLICKIFLADRASNTYGGIYLWQDRATCEDFKRSDLFASVGGHPNLTGITVREFDVLEEPTRVTRGLMAVAS
jgi:putative monooxygenase ydhR